MIFKVYDCDFGFVRNGINYEFEHVVELTVEDTLRNRVTRGSNASDGPGLRFRDGLREPVRWLLPILNMTQELKEVLDEVFENAEFIDVYCIDRKTGSKKSLDDAVLSNRPQQLLLDETQESMSVSLEFEGYRSRETHKDS